MHRIIDELKSIKKEFSINELKNIKLIIDGEIDRREQKKGCTASTGIRFNPYNKNYFDYD